MGIVRRRQYPYPTNVKDEKGIISFLKDLVRALNEEGASRLADFNEYSESAHTHDYSASSHTHDLSYISLISSPVADNFPLMTAGGKLATSAYGNSTYATAAHTHTGLTTSGTMVVASDVTNSTQVMANVTGLSFAVAASKKYGFRFLLEGTTTSATNALWVQFTGPASPTSFYAYVEMKTTADAYREQQELTAFSTATTYTSFGIVNDHCISIEGFLCNGVNAGTVQLQFRNEAAAQTVTVYAGSWGHWYLLD